MRSITLSREILVQIDAPHFCAGLVFDETGHVVETAPILNYMVGWSHRRVMKYVQKKSWSMYVKKKSWSIIVAPGEPASNVETIDVEESREANPQSSHESQS